MSYPSLLSDLRIFTPSLLLCLDDFLLSKDMLLFSLIAFHNQRVGNPYVNPLASPINVSNQVLKQFPKTRLMYCEMDPLRDLATHLIWRMMELGVDLKASIMQSWCHGVLSFDLKGGVPDSHRSIEINVEYFKELFQCQKIS